MAVPTKSFDPEYPKKIGDKVIRTSEEEFHYKQRLAAQQGDVAELKTEIEYLNGRCRGLTDAIQSLKKENEQLKAQLAAATTPAAPPEEKKK